MKVWDYIHFLTLVKYSKKKTNSWFEIVSQPNIKPSLQAQVTAKIFFYKMHLLLLFTQPVAIIHWKARGNLLSSGFQPKHVRKAEQLEKGTTSCWHGNIKFTQNSSGGSQDAPAGPDLNVMFLEDSSKVLRLSLNSQNAAGLVPSIRQ